MSHNQTELRGNREPTSLSFYLKSKKLNCINGPVHVVLDPLVELDEVLLGDDVVGVEIQDVVEEIFELILLEARQQILG